MDEEEAGREAVAAGRTAWERSAARRCVVGGGVAERVDDDGWVRVMSSCEGWEG